MIPSAPEVESYRAAFCYERTLPPGEQPTESIFHPGIPKMGYITSLHLVDVKIKEESLPAVRRAVETRKGRGLGPIVCFLEEAFLAEDGFLCFKSTGQFDSPYCPDDEDGTVTVLEGKWYESRKIAEWLKLHAEKGGRLIEHSCEADGCAWGWEFDGKGRLRQLALCSVGRWS
jgi:hypothetical protein